MKKGKMSGGRSQLSSGGQVVAATTHKPKPRLVPTDKCSVVNQSGRQVKYACGHTFAARFAHNLYGQIFELLDEMLAKRDKCGECLLQDSINTHIRCALCGRVILPGEGVATYHNNGSFNHKWTTVVEDRVIGCLRMNCCPSGGCFSGHWTGKEFKPAFQHGSAAEEVMATGGVLLVNDTTLK